MSGKSRNFKLRHNRNITNYRGPGPALLQEFTDHIAGSMLPSVPQHLVEYQKQLREKKSSVANFFSVIEESFEDARISPRLQGLLNKAFVISGIKEEQITASFLLTMMDALDQLKDSYKSGSPDREYLDKLISAIFSFYKLIKPQK